MHWNAVNSSRYLRIRNDFPIRVPESSGCLWMLANQLISRPSSAERVHQPCRQKIFSELVDACQRVEMGALQRACDGLSQQFIGDDQALDLVGAFIDLVQLGIAHVLFHRVILHVPIATEHLHRIRRDLHRGIARKTFGDGRFLGVAQTLIVEMSGSTYRRLTSSRSGNWLAAWVNGR
jgi:hypothetical protein